MKNDFNDLSTKAHALRQRIHVDERALAIAYPDKAEELQSDLDRERAQLAELEPKIAEAKVEATRAMLDAVDAYFAARHALTRLNGYYNDPGFKHLAFARCALTKAPSMGPGGTRELHCEPQQAFEVREALVQAVEMLPAPAPQVPEHQRIHDERVKNERAGRGHFSDAQLADIEQRGEAAWHGAGWSRPKAAVAADD